MKVLGRKNSFVFLLICCAILVGGCLPHVSQVVEVIRPLPLGISHAEVSKALINAYGKKYRRCPQSYDLSDPPTRMTEAKARAEKDMIGFYKRKGWYTYVYPVDLLETMSTSASMQMVGLASVRSHSNGYVALYFDKDMNYSGFVAASTEKTR